MQITISLKDSILEKLITNRNAMNPQIRLPTEPCVCARTS